MTAEKNDLHILYTDRDVLVVEKPEGVPSVQDISGDLSLPQLLSEQLGIEPPTVITRLDRGVSGITLLAKNKAAEKALSKIVQERAEMKKTYLACLSGIPEEREGEMTDLLFHDGRNNKTYPVKRIRKGVKEAKLSYKVLEVSGENALVEVHLETGRTHQIRVQFATRKLPLLGDGKYGSKENCPLGLFCMGLSFPHPKTGEILSFTLPKPEAPPFDRFGENEK